MASEIRVNKITHTAGVGTITTSADGIVVAGIVTANNFSGDITGNVTGSGANLTNLPAGQLTGTLPAISGANLTGIDATSIKDSGGNVRAQANNSGVVITGVATATSFEYSSHPGHSVFTGNNSTTAFTIQAGHSVNSILVVYNGAVLTPTTDYTVSGTTLTMNGFTPPTNAHICVRYLIK